MADNGTLPHAERCGGIQIDLVCVCGFAVVDYAVYKLQRALAPDDRRREVDDLILEAHRLPLADNPGVRQRDGFQFGGLDRLFCFLGFFCGFRFFRLFGICLRLRCFICCQFDLICTDLIGRHVRLEIGNEEVWAKFPSEFLRFLPDFLSPSGTDRQCFGHVQFIDRHSAREQLIFRKQLIQKFRILPAQRLQFLRRNVILGRMNVQNRQQPA